jgi:hypothetical protein
MLIDWGHDADQRAKLLIYQPMKRSTLNAYLQTDSISNSCLSTKRAVGHERLLRAVSRRCRQTGARSSSNSSISRNSRLAQSASSSSKGRSYRYCSDHRKSRRAENAVVPVTTWDWIDIPGALTAARHARNRSFLGVSWKAVIRWLMIARQEAVAVPAWRQGKPTGHDQSAGWAERIIARHSPKPIGT